MERGTIILVSAVIVVGLCSLLAVAGALGYFYLWSGRGCSTVLDADVLDRLQFGMEQTVQLQPGATHTFSLGVIECCYYFEPVDACAAWSVDPTEGTSIDPETGVLTVDDDTPSGSVYTVNADVENGRRQMSIEVHVFTPDDNPLVGIWKEETQFDCGTGEEVAPEQAIGELRFRADGGFSVTWMPFEVYEDYWGSYAYDMAPGTLDLVITGGNYIPDDVDSEGTFLFDEHQRLILRDMWLGRPSDGTSPASCGHRFARVR